MKPFTKRDYFLLFTSTLKLSAFTFGGGFVIIPLMRKRFVEELHWIEEEEMVDLTVIAQSSPGAIAVNAAILVGYRVGGLLGALVSLIGTVLPPLIIISIISIFYQAFRDNLYVGIIMRGMLAGVAAVIIDVVWRMGQQLMNEKRLLPLIVMVLTFIASRYLRLNILLIIVICALIGALDSWYRMRRQDGEI
ncbi:chromate transporter [Globicatella sanguinis]|uniref:chromate transporter n=1 Tax=Globicatella sanguinis TaxID=13076 RepID=UPI000AAC8CD6|nr:chromate transporter [Globicatella sanguinis]MDK7630928.1 chromate transporter [Globicatella sanguinis]WIK67409.1 chromate transporter [Globicatella sanguinis]WKT56814.1 chromate transporter [Globicatella sanguinis]